MTTYIFTRTVYKCTSLLEKHQQEFADTSK